MSAGQAAGDRLGEVYAPDGSLRMEYEGGAMSVTACPACGMATGEGRFCRSCGLDLTAPARASAMVPVLYVEPGTHPPGSLLAGRYRIIGRLATGSMGMVYAVEDLPSGE